MDIVVQYMISLIPVIIAISGEIAVIAKAIAVFKEAKESKEFKALIEQNKTLIIELRQERKLTKELLTKIDGIQRKRGE